MVRQPGAVQSSIQHRADSATNLFVTDSLTHTIRKITPGGSVSHIAGLAGVWGSVDGTNSGARFFQPNGIVVANASNIFRGRLRATRCCEKSPPAERTGSSAPSPVCPAVPAAPTARAARHASVFLPAWRWTGAGELYVADSGNNLIRTTRIVRRRCNFGARAISLSRRGQCSSGRILFWRPAVTDRRRLDSAFQWIVVSGDNIFQTNNSSSPAFYRLRKP